MATSTRPLPMKLKDAFALALTRVHRLFFTVSKGRVSGQMFGLPVIELVTVGRRSGKERSTMLTVPVVDGDQLVLVASYGGDDRHPAWYLNLRARPEVRVTMAGTTRAMAARTATDEERATLWPRITAHYSGYAAYQKRTDRQIPVVVLEPR